MAIVRPFSCIRPEASVVSNVAALPYDVYNRKEACQVTAANPMSFLNIDRAETQFSEDVDTYAPQVYDKARELLVSNPRMEVQQIAAETGFSDASHFIAMFKKITGVTPLEFRRLN